MRWDLDAEFVPLRKEKGIDFVYRGPKPTIGPRGNLRTVLEGGLGIKKRLGSFRAAGGATVWEASERDFVKDL